ncbi:MAG: aminomethyl-transferring glycine dehydrogenase subunit GcvPB [Chloroflexi bacterium]|nr:aminomethyl-transferring glycine dehydrogenase subunit GcvPB [Chloroflexota bacterium]
MIAPQQSEPHLYELSSPGRTGINLPALDVPETPLPQEYLRLDLPLPEVSEIDVVRHFTRLSTLNYAIDTGIYPLGSCTMKYNPKINEDVARYPGFALLHPYQDESTVQGALQLMYEMQGYLAEIAGMHSVTLQPAAGAHGELTGMLVIRAYQRHIGQAQRTRVLVPDSAHGTNPATAAMCGFTVTGLPTDDRGNLDVAAVEREMDETVAGLMLTNPSTLGLFEEHILEVAEIVHRRGGLIYCDGANMNAMLGIARPGELGMDVLHYNQHKTFSTPHGGGGPGAGATAVVEKLAPFLPAPIAAQRADGTYYWDYDRPLSIGRVRSFHGNFGNIVRGYAFIRAYGSDLRDISFNAVLNANYVQARLRGAYDLPYDRHCKHEVVFSGRRQVKLGVHTLDIAKRLIDYGIHPPTIYFPLIVPEAIMIEPTETESRESLDNLCEIFLKVAQEAVENPEVILSAPHTAPVSRLDEAGAARRPNLRYFPEIVPVEAIMTK